jgi:predicted DNA-binding protein
MPKVMSVRLPDRLADRLRERAAALDITQAKLMCDLLEGGLDKQDQVADYHMSQGDALQRKIDQLLDLTYGSAWVQIASTGEGKTKAELLQKMHSMLLGGSKVRDEISKPN